MKRLKKGQGIAWIIILALCLGGLGYYAGLILGNTVKKGDDSLKLGLDLAGGVSITYEAVGDGTPTEEQMNDTITKLQQRIENDLGEESSTTEASVYKVGTDRIAVEIPGVSDANALLEELGTPGTLYFIAQTDADGNENYGYGYDEDGNYTYVLNSDIDTLLANGSVICTGKNVSGSQPGANTNKTTGATEYVVQLSFDKEGTEAFAEATTKAYANGESIAIYYDGEILSAPTVQAAITNGSCIIEGNYDYDGASKLASYIRIGGLDITLQELESQVVGASLGSDALSTSLKAGGIGLALVMVFLIVMYLLPGVVASIALAIYTALLITILYLFDITLTLPGIAGMILSIGMAVDANVIIFARIREEIKGGRSVVSSIETGFSKALSAILDGNITTLIAAAVLGVIGTGSVKGFAITLALGVILSMFTALVITRILINSFYAIGLRDEKLYGKAKEPVKFDFVGKKAIFLSASALVIAAGLIAMAVFGATSGKSLNYSLEFLGGTSTTVDFGQEYTLEQLDAEVVPQIADVIGSNDIQTTLVDSSDEVIFKTQGLDGEQRTALANMLYEKYGVEEGSITTQTIGSTISGEMRRQSLIAVIVAALFMLLYIWFRFRDFRFASSAIIALIHDVLVVLAFYAICRISVGSAFIACMLTVIGYSVNDTIVIFDRIRENHKSVTDEKPETLASLCNSSLSQTLSRSISTSITTAIMVLMLLILGVASIREFALPLLAGVICGTYSSIFIATQLWYILKVKIKKN